MKNIKSTILLLAFLLPLASLAKDINPIEKIMDRVFEGVSKGKSDNAAKTSLASMEADGSWAEIDYKVRDITKWEPSKHLDKITSMAQAYANKDGSLYGDKNLYDGIVKGLQFWYDADPKSDNWWHNEISVPQKLGVLLIIANYGKQKVPVQLKANLIERMKRGAPDDKTGANKTDIATHFFYRALLTDDVKLLAFSLDQLFLPVQLVDGEEGLQYDYSYLQHGPQLYISGYGEVYISGVLKVVNYVKGTSYALSKDKLAIFSAFYRNTFLNTIRGRYIDFNLEGRGISRVDRLKKTEKATITEMKEIDPENAAEWDKELARFSNTSSTNPNVQPFHKHFWKADYTLHVRPNYNFGIRTSSKRTKRSEAGNKENLYGRYLSDGATNIQVNGPEYYNIMPIWEWDKIPGTTSRNYKEDRLLTKTWGEDGFNDFSGGVSDGVYGATAYQIKYDSVSAKKAWFLFDNEIVCLGADINSITKEDVTTTINQAWLKGDVSLSDNVKIKTGDLVNYEAKKQSWLYHANTGYFFPDGGQLSLSTKTQTGNWFKINNSFSKDEVSGDVFKFWINHGAKPDHAKYAYIVVPAIKSADEMKTYNAKVIEILANTAEQQAVYQQQLKILQAVFHKPSKLETEAFSISVDKPCILMIKEGDAGKKELFISDPLYKEKSITVTYTDKKIGKSKETKISLPDGPYLGSTKKVELVF